MIKGRWTTNTILPMFFSYVLAQTPQFREILISKGRSVTMNSTLNFNGYLWEGRLAVDGNKQQDDPENCRCCAASAEDTPGSIMVLDLQNFYKISRIVIYGRNDGNENGIFTDSEVYLSNQSSIGGISRVQILTQPSYENIIIPPQDRSSFRYVIFKTTQNVFLIICEIQVYMEVCINGYYGDCITSCGRCTNNDVCDKVTGACPNGCMLGYQGSRCDEECNNKTFGDNCTQTCNCVSDCHHIHGNCTVVGCLDGWTGISCTVKYVTPQDDGMSPLPIVGAVVGTIFLCACVVVVIVLLMRRRRRNKKPANAAGTSKYYHELMTGRRRQEIVYANGGLQDSSYDVIEASYENNQQGIKVHDIWNYIKLKSLEKFKELAEEYESVPLKIDKPITVAVLPENIKKNRYREIHPYDENRVQLSESEEDGDYINASYINGVDVVRKFIASQGPTKATVDDFWRMIWEKRVMKIVMLNTIDNIKSRKVVKYWSNDKVAKFGNLSITVTSFVKTDDYDIRNIKIALADGNAHDLQLFHFKSWPDKDVPSTTWSIVHFWRKVNETDTPKQPGKIVVHCSTGVGPTGIYIALDCLYNEALQRGEIKPIETLRRLREQRPYMVQTKEQYVFLHEALADALNFGTHHVLRSQFEQIYLYMTRNEEKTNKSRLELQYELIVKSLEQPMFENTLVLPYENMDSIQTDRNSCKTNSESWFSKTYQDFGAICLESHTGEDGLITCKLPPDNRIIEFWKMVTEANFKTVVFVHEKSKDQSPNTSIRLFEYTRWKRGYVIPNETAPLLTFLESIMTWQPKVKMAKPILVCCSDGASQSGLVCVLLNELCRMRETDGQINVVESVKIMKQRNRRIIPEFAQYKFCYDVIREACSRSQEATHSGDPTYENE